MRIAKILVPVLWIISAIAAVPMIFTMVIENVIPLVD